MQRNPDTSVLPSNASISGSQMASLTEVGRIKITGRLIHIAGLASAAPKSIDQSKLTETLFHQSSSFRAIQPQDISLLTPCSRSAALRSLNNLANSANVATISTEKLDSNKLYKSLLGLKRSTCLILNGSSQQSLSDGSTTLSEEICNTDPLLQIDFAEALLSHPHCTQASIGIEGVTNNEHQKVSEHNEIIVQESLGHFKPLSAYFKKQENIQKIWKRYAKSGKNFHDMSNVPHVAPQGWGVAALSIEPDGHSQNPGFSLNIAQCELDMRDYAHVDFAKELIKQVDLTAERVIGARLTDVSKTVIQSRHLPIVASILDGFDCQDSTGFEKPASKRIREDTLEQLFRGWNPQINTLISLTEMEKASDTDTSLVTIDCEYFPAISIFFAWV